MKRSSIIALVTVLAVGCALAASSPAPTQAAAPDHLSLALGRALTAPGVAASRTAALAVDLETGEVVFNRNESQALAPASAEKLAVSFAALRLLGPGYRFRTEVAGRGELVGGVWRGDLFLVGHGDPTLAPADLDALSRDVAAWGIRRVAGRVLGDEGHFDSARSAPGWKPWFLGVESAPLSALSVDERREPRRQRLGGSCRTSIHGTPLSAAASPSVELRARATLPPMDCRSQAISPSRSQRSSGR